MHFDRCAPCIAKLHIHVDHLARESTTVIWTTWELTSGEVSVRACCFVTRWFLCPYVPTEPSCSLEFLLLFAASFLPHSMKGMGPRAISINLFYILFFFFISVAPWSRRKSKKIPTKICQEKSKKETETFNLAALNCSLIATVFNTCEFVKIPCGGLLWQARVI